MRHLKALREAATTSANTALIRGKKRPGKTVEPGRGKHSDKWDKCVKDVKKKGGAADPYAVCTTSVGRSESMRFLVRFREADAVANAQPGRRFGVVLLEEGLGNFGDAYYYTSQAIQSCPVIFEGKKFYIDHPDAIQEETLPERSVRDIAGWFENLRAEPAQDDGRMCLVGDAVLSSGINLETARSLMMDSIEYGKRHPDQEFVGLSINAGGDFDTMALDQFMGMGKIPSSCLAKLQEAMQAGVKMVRPVSRMTHAKSCDLVTEAGAGGRISQLIEREKGNMGKKIESEKKETEGKTQEDGAGGAPAKDGAADGKSGGADGAHDDKAQDEELIQSMMKKYMGDGFSEEDKAMAHEAYQHAMEATGGDKDEAMKMAGYNFKMAKHIQAKSMGQPAEAGTATEAEGGKGFTHSGTGPTPSKTPHSAQETAETKESNRGPSKKEIELAAEVAKLKGDLEGERLEKFIDKTLKESKLPMRATKQFRESAKGLKSEKDVAEKFKWFREAYLVAGEGEEDGFMISAEKTSGQSSGGMSFADCKESD